jgi:hypothetical protein
LTRSPLARIGRKKAGKAGRRATVVEHIRNRDVSCQFWNFVCANWMELEIVAPPCSGHLDVHEIVPRSVWPDGDLDENNCVLLCRVHHSWLDGDRYLAEQIGLYRRFKPL